MCSVEWCKYLKPEAAGTLTDYRHKNSVPKAAMLSIKLCMTTLHIQSSLQNAYR